MELIHQGIDILLHLDVYLSLWMGALGFWMYPLVFAIIFCETGLVVTPFLPGDSLLFALGALAALEGSPLQPEFLIVLLIFAALCGDLTNYSLGRWIGEKVFQTPHSRIFRRDYLVKTQNFYERHGGKTIILARFMPIVRTFAPFVAGLGEMRFTRYIAYCIGGATAWVTLFIMGGYWLGNLPAVKSRFHVVILGIILISVAPGIFEYLRHRKGQHGHA